MRRKKLDKILFSLTFDHKCKNADFISKIKHKYPLDKKIHFFQFTAICFMALNLPAIKKKK